MKNQKGFIVPLLIVIIALLAFGGGTYVYVKNKPISEVNQREDISVSSDTISNQNTEKTVSNSNIMVFGSDDSIKKGQVLTPQQEVVKQTITKTASTATTATVKNCGKDMSCLIATASTCGPANVSWTFTIDFMGKPLTSTDNINITKISSGKCSLTL